MNKPKVSISCITYNHAPFIAEALESFLMQKTEFDFEILVHDDASNDGTIEILRSYEDQYPEKIKVIYQTENQYSKGVTKISYRFNDTRALGEYIAVCEGDDCWTDPYKLQKQIDFLERNPDYSLCVHAAEIKNFKKERVGEFRPFSENCTVPLEKYILKKTNFFATNSLVYRKTALEPIPDFFLEAPVGDIPTILVLGVRGKIYYLDEFMSVYRLGSQDSWGRRFKKWPLEKKLAHSHSMIKMFSEFDKFSNHKYHQVVQEANQYQRFRMLKLEGKYSEIQKDQLLKRYYDELSFKSKMGIYIHEKSPFFWQVFQDRKK